MTTKDTILIADDDPSLRQVLSILLESEGFKTLLAEDGAECLRAAYEHHPNLILLDIMMPNRDGREVCQRLREISNVPIIMLTALGDDQEKIDRLKEGADDYVTKPYHNAELVARIRALLRRSRQGTMFAPREYADDCLHIDFESHQLRVKNQLVAISPKEWRLMERMVAAEGRVVTRQELLQYAWGREYETEFNYLKVYVAHLRRKLGDSAKHPHYIHTERDVGYRFEKRK
jgi:DNA-binding response OmpR family regulator